MSRQRESQTSIVKVVSFALAVAFVFALAFSAAPSAFAAGPACADLFRPAHPAAVTYQSLTSEVNALALRLQARAFSRNKFNIAFENYRQAGADQTVESLRQPKTREERLAFFRYVSDLTGRNPYDLELWAEQAKPKDLKRLANSLGKINLERGFSPTQVDDMVWKLFLFSSRSPLSFKNLQKLGPTQMDRVALEQWTTKELASASALEGFQRLGLIKGQKGISKWMDVVRAHPNLVSTLLSGSMMAFETFVMRSPLSAPNYSRLRITKLDAQLRDVVERDGFDAAYPLLKARYGDLVEFDRGIYFARRVFTTSLMTFMVANMYPQVAQVLLPPMLLEKNAGVAEMTKTLVVYYGELALYIAEDHFHGNDKLESELVSRHVVHVKPQVVSGTNDQAVTQDRVPLTYREQLHQEPAKQAKAASPTSADDPSEKAAIAAQSNLDYLNTLDFSAKKEN